MTPCCRVCGTELVDGLVTCERCQTPHHKDCWEYWGRCATYGCTGLEQPSAQVPVLDEPAVLEVRASGRARYLPRRAMVEAHGALMYSQEGAHVRLSDGEVAMQLPPDLALELPAPRWPRNAGVVGTGLFTFATVMGFIYGAIYSLLHGDLVALGGATVLGAIAQARIRNRSGARRADRMWMVKQVDGYLALEALVPGRLGPLDRLRLRFPLVIPGGELLRATGVRLRPAFGGGDERDVVKAYRLLLACALPGGGAELIAPVAVPGKGEPRGEFLKELTRVRALGRQVATHYGVPYEES